MADETTATWVNLWREAKGPLVEALKWKTVLLSEVKRDHAQKKWNGKQITIPIFLSPQQGAGGASETGLLNQTQLVDTAQTVINSGIVHIPISFSTMVLQQAKGDENVWAEVMPTKMQRAEDAFGRVINEMMAGFGDGLLAAFTGSVTASGGAVQTANVGTSANFYQLYPGRIVNVLVRASGATVGATNADGSSKEVKISDYNQGTGIVTFKYADGSATSFGTDNTMGFYIQGTYGKAIQGLQQALATSSPPNFQGINKSNVWAFRGVDASPGSASNPSMAVFDAAERKAYQYAGRQPDFYLADPAVVDLYSQGIASFARWTGEDAQLKTGWTGVKYRNKAIVPDYDHPIKQATGVQLSDCTIYTLQEGPDWDDNTGAVLQRFGNRSLPVEAWLVWFLQYGFQACNGFVKVGNLNQAP